MRVRTRLTGIVAALLTIALAAPAGAAPAPPPADFIAASGTLSQPQFPEIVTEALHVDMPDGEKLYVEVARPDPELYGDMELPVVMEASPYHGTIHARTGTRIFPDPRDEQGEQVGLTGFFVPRGYAVVMVDLRGTGKSTGCLDHLGPKDASDLKTIIEWAADQPWSNGRVGLTGHSYVGSTPSVAAAQNPRGLATIVPSAGLASMYDHQFQKGVPYNLQWVGPMVAYEGLSAIRDLPPGFTEPVLTGGQTGDNWGSAPNHQAACGMQHSALTAGSGQATGQYELWHAQRDWRDGAAEADIPVFMIHGVNDNAARIPAAEWFFGRRFHRAGDKTWIGQWDHGSTNGRCGTPNNQRTLHPTCRFDQFKYALLAWFDKHLKGADVDTGPAVEAFLNGRDPISVTQVIDPEKVGGKVHTADAWRHPAVRRTVYLDATDNSLSFERPTATGTRTFGRNASAVAAHVGATSAAFTSEPMTEDTVFLGVPRMNLNASVVGGPITHITVTLFRENAAGNREPMNTCAIQPQLRYGVHDIAPVVPAQEMSLPMTCFTMAHWVPAGQKLVAQVATTTPHHATFGSDPQITIHTGPGRSSYVLPVVPDATLHNDVPLRE